MGFIYGLITFLLLINNIYSVGFMCFIMSFLVFGISKALISFTSLPNIALKSPQRQRNAMPNLRKCLLHPFAQKTLENISRK